MAWDDFIPRGSRKASTPQAGGANPRLVPVIGIVKDNIDPIRAGRLQVYVSDFGGNDSNNSNSWTTVRYMSHFYGLTQASGSDTGWGEFLKNPHSYGMWHSPPDIGTAVVCFFINGDPNYGYYLGSVVEPEALQMVPAIGATDNIVPNAGEAKSYGGATRLPVTNINTNNKGMSDKSTWLSESKPIHSVVAGILSQQGLLRDSIRGTIGSSSQRESPSRVGFGVSTPGRPIYEGGFSDSTVGDAAANSGQQSALKIVARQGGHSLVMDDGDLIGDDQLVRLRTATGHQILMSDSGQTLFIIHANGQSWVELGKEGTIDLYSTNSVNVRTQGDLNLHADNNININAAKALNVSAETIKITSEKETTQRTGTDFSLYSVGKYTVKVDGAMSMASAGEASYYSDSTTYINGSKINLNTGAAGSIPAEVKPIPLVAHTDTLFDATVGWAPAPGKLMSIVSRAPAHSPWASANQGVDVKVSGSASSQLPPAPSPAVAAANANAGTPTNPVKTAVAATAPASATAVSKAIDGPTTAAMITQVSTMAATGPAAAAVKLGAGIVDTGSMCKVAVGAMAADASKLVADGTLKPGADTLINGITKATSDVNKLLTPNLFTGASGKENLGALVNNVSAQAAGVVSGLQQAQSALTAAGVITGKEAGNAIAGPVMAAYVAGPSAAIDAIKNAAGAVGSSISGAAGAVAGAVTGAVNAVGGALGSAANALSSGNFAGNLAASVTGGLSSLAGAVKSSIAGVAGLIDSAKGVAAGAFAAITKTFKAMTPGVPQNLTALAEKATAAETAVADAVPGEASALNAVKASFNPSSSLIDTATGAAGAVAAVANIGDAAKGAVGAATAVIGAGNSVIGAATTMASDATAAVDAAANAIKKG